VNRASRHSIIPKIIIFLGTLSVVGIILLFFRRDELRGPVKIKPDTDDKLFSEIIRAAEPQILRLWTEGPSLENGSPRCKEEIIYDKKTGSAYFHCQPHLWQCYWQGGVSAGDPGIKLELFGQSYHVRANPVFPAIASYSEFPRYYEMLKLSGSGLNLHYGYQVEMTVKELPGFSQRLLLTDSCRDTYLPERIYGYGKRPAHGEGFIWDNFGRRIFIDKFYVSNQMMNEYRILNNQPDKIVSDRSFWPHPAIVSLTDQKNYCAFFGKRLLSAELFDAASMMPADFTNPKPLKVTRAQTPWQRDLSKTFLGVARINPDYQLTPLACQLAQVEGCREKYFTTDSASWMGMNFSLGFYPESLENTIDPDFNLKLSSRYLPASSPWHELGARSRWDGKNSEKPVAFRCYEEVEI
jgi:hypothetical protein